MKLSKSIFNLILLVSVLSTIFITIIFILFQFNNFEKESTYTRNEFINAKKDLLKKEVSYVYNYIEYQEKIKKNLIQQRLKNRVNQAYTIAKSIYDKNVSKISKEEIQYLIVSALKEISYENNRQYFFINSNDGRAILFNKKSFLDINKSVWDFRDVKGNYIVRRQSEIALEKKEGFIQNYFIKPDLKDDKQYPKLSFIKNFEEFNWHIGMGEYLDDFLFESKQEILKYIASIRFGNDGYIFVNRIDKKALVFDGTKLDKPKEYPNNDLFKKQLQAIKNKNGDFIFYHFKKLNSEKKYPKLAFVKAYENWNWIIGTGIYIDEIETQIEQKSHELKQNIISQLSIIALILICTIIFVYFISKNLTLRLTHNLNTLTQSFNESSKNLSIINIEKLTFKEFKKLAYSLNQVLFARNETEKKLKDYIDIVNNYVITSSTDENGIITDVSNAFCNISGFSKEELIGNNHNIVRHPDMPDEIYKDLWKTIKSGKVWKGELKNQKKDGSYYWVDIVIQPIFKKEKIVGYTAIRQDITNKKIVEYLSITDELTKLYNRRYFNIKIEEELNRVKRDNLLLSFIILDIDYFKNYNDTYGHLLGDKALKDVSEVLINMTNRSSDFAFRLGGEEFGLILINQDKKSVFEYAQKIRQSIEELHIEHKTSKISNNLTASIGIVTRNGNDIKDSSEIYRLADEALYISKRNGRNQVNEL
jgi:diguanylate cyclase (GGDEF)-like protein/PAS domain S-box-containing protein